ncbi:hypothetical protein MMC13_005761 [Lambiella insularis]|nr:hypothetical protein [Lambiella insularis]
MLGPFRIRNLGRPTSPANRASYAPASRRGAPDAIVAVTETEYDTNVMKNPESKLRYLDEDDGEVVTVGTSLELSQRLSEPVPKFARTMLQDHMIARGDNTANALLPALPNTHVFEIDRQGDSTRIWGEIEERTRQYRLSEALSQPERVSNGMFPMGSSNDHLMNAQFSIKSMLSVDDMTQKPHTQDHSQPSSRRSHDSVSNVHNRSKEAAGVWFNTSDCVRQTEKKPENVASLKKASPVGDPCETQEDERIRYFKASNPPQLLHERNEHNNTPARHTSMRVSDVLNEDAEPKEMCEETAPLLENFREGNLTAEGRRQAMEAGKRLRCRVHPVLQAGSNGSSRSQKFHNDRWAMYGAAVHTSEAPSQPLKGSSNVEPIASVTPIIQAPLNSGVAVPPLEGSLLHAFRTELAKISQPGKQIPTERSLPDNSLSSSQATVRVMPRSRPSPSGSDLEYLTRNLVLQTIISVGSNVETLKSQLQSHVLDILPEHMDRPRNTPIKYHLRNACSDFTTSVDAATASLAVEPSMEDLAGKTTGDASYPTLPSAIRGLQSMTYAIDTLIQRLRMIEDSKERMVNQERPTSQKSSETDFVVCGVRQSQLASGQPLEPVSKQALGQGVQTRNAGPKVHHFEAEKEQVTRKSTGPSVRFKDTEAQFAEPQTVHADARVLEDRREEPSISYRHVPSPMSWEGVDQSRGRQPLKHSQSFSSGLPYEYVVPPPQGDFQYERRPIPEPEIHRGSRSRSRSPAAKITRTAPEYRAPTPPSTHSRQQPLRQSGLPVRHHHRPDSGNAALRHTRNALRHFGSTNALNHDHKSFGYRPLPQQRPLDLPGTGSARNTLMLPSDHQYAIHSRQAHGIEDKNRLVTAAFLRHAKSLSSIRKPPAPLKLGEFRARARESWEAHQAPPRPMTEPSDDQGSKAKALLTASSAVKGGLPNSARPSSPLVATRFPTLEQFESTNRIIAPQFPPLPSMEPLVPLRPNQSHRDAEAKVSPILLTGFTNVHEDTPSNLNGDSPHQSISQVEKTESSGDFFRRMTGLVEAPKIPASPISPVRLGPAAPGARLARPFDPHAETATIHRHQLLEGVRRSATVAGLHDRYTTTNRRPYSAYFDGNGRVEWDAFIKGNQSAGAPARLQREDATATMPNLPGQPRQPMTRSELRSPQRRKTVHNGASTPVHHDPSTVSSVQSCVQQLQDLGFGDHENGGARRLVVYAQAANGNLGDAIDMIDEEMRAYEERKAKGC